MKFKVGDKVRLTREAIINIKIDLPDCYYTGFTIDNIEGEVVYGGGDRIHNEHLELVPEEPEFEYGEEIEVSHEGDIRVKRIFICKSPCSKFPYLCIYGDDSDKFKKGDRFSVWGWEYVRKCKPKLTRKEIAEKLGVSEDFTLID